MRAKVTEDCTACGLCTEICPDVFQMGDEYAEVQVDEIPDDLKEEAEEAADSCPVDAIILE